MLDYKFLETWNILEKLSSDRTNATKYVKNLIDKMTLEERTTWSNLPIERKLINELNVDKYYDYLDKCFIENGGRYLDRPDQRIHFHHIILRSLGGEDKDINNFICLTSSQHTKAHEILADDNKDCSQAVRSFYCLNHHTEIESNLSPEELVDWNRRITRMNQSSWVNHMLSTNLTDDQIKVRANNLKKGHGGSKSALVVEYNDGTSKEYSNYIEFFNDLKFKPKNNIKINDFIYNLIRRQTCKWATLNNIKKIITSNSVHTGKIWVVPCIYDADETWHPDFNNAMCFDSMMDAERKLNIANQRISDSAKKNSNDLHADVSINPIHLCNVNVNSDAIYTVYYDEDFELAKTTVNELIKL